MKLPKSLSFPWSPLRTITSALLGVVAILAAYHFLSAPRAAHEAAAANRANQTGAEAQQHATAENVRTVERYHTETQRIETRTVQSNAAIAAAPGADRPVDPGLALAWRRSLCLHDDRTDGLCTELLHGHDLGSGVEGSHGPRADTGR